MTTSVLMTHCRDGLGDNDLQVLRDYALEAPWTWRIALESLIDIAVKSDKIEEEAEKAGADNELTKEAYKELQANVKNATATMLSYVEKLEAGRKAGDLTKGELELITEGIRSSFEKLVDAAD